MAAVLAGARRCHGGNLGLLEAGVLRLEAGGLECVLAGARQVKNLPGRPKRDTTGSAWLACCFERGSVFPCFVATPEFWIIGLHTRRRRDLTGERSREKQRAEKLPEDAALKLPSVLTGLHGVTGRDIMDRLIAGQRDPKTLAGCARTRARAKIPQLREALAGAQFFTAHHARLLASILSRTGSITAEISELSAVIEELPAPHEEQLAQAEPVPGWGRRAAQDVIAGTGADMTRFPTGGHLASWAGRTPLDKQSGARAGQRRHKHGNNYISALTGETAAAAGKTGTREGARHRRNSRNRGKAKACAATGNTQLRVFHPLLPRPRTRYHDPGAGWYDDQRQAARPVSRLAGALGAIGYKVTRCRKPAPGPEATPAA